MVPPTLPANPGDILLIEQSPGASGWRLRLTITGQKLTWSLSNNDSPSNNDIGSRLSEFAPGSRVTLYAADGASPIAWTVESFQGLHQEVGSQSTAEIQFSQRCLLSGSGLATWRLLVSTDGFGGYSLKYDLTVESNFAAPQSKNYLLSLQFNKASRPTLKFRLRLDPGARPILNHSFKILSVRESDVEVNCVVDSEGSDLQYQAQYSAPNNTHLGNGIVLETDIHTKLLVWQSCQYLLDDQCVRMIEAGVDGLSTANVFNSWNNNIAAPYLASLTGNNAFSAVPRISVDAPHGASSPKWRVSLLLDDKYDFAAVKQYCDAHRVSNCVFSSQIQQWLILDADFKQPELTAPTEPYISSRVLRVAIMGGSSNQGAPQIGNVVATMTKFRMQDGSAVVLNNIVLTSPPSGDPSYPWSLLLSGVSWGTSEALGKDGSQPVIRVGAFELYLSDMSATDASTKPAKPKTQQPFYIGFGADYGVTICPPDIVFAQPATGPRPQIDLYMQPFPLLDVGPASEDDLTSDQFALPNQRIPMSRLACTVGNIASDESDEGARIEQEIQINFQREGPVVFRRPVVAKDSSGNTTTKVQKTADGDWNFAYSEQSFVGLKQTVRMQLWFAPTYDPSKPAPVDESVLVLDRVPFTFAEVHFHPLKMSDANASTQVAEWDSQTNEWRIVEISGQPSWLLLAPQVVGEEVVRDSSYYPVALDNHTQPRMLLGTPTVVTYTQSKSKNYVQVPWNLRRLFTDASVKVSRLDYEMLYGLACSTKAPHMRLTESSTLYGDIRPGLPQNPAGFTISSGADASYRNARLYWSSVWREYQSRLGVLVVEDANKATDPEDFQDTANTQCQLRLQDNTRNFVPDPPISNYLGQGEILPDPSDPANFKGGALAGVEDSGIYRAIITNPTNTAKLEPQSTAGALTAPRFSALGGYGTTMARFDLNKSTLINTIAMGRSVTYSVERVGRIGCFWNRAKHVVVYERTVLPSRQFYLSQKRFGGIPLLRKVEEYVEFLETDRLFTNETQTPQAGFLKGFKCGEKKRIPVDSAWGSSVVGQGWKVPLWNPGAAAKLPDVYPMPHLFAEVSTPEQASGSSANQPQFVTRDCRLAHPQEVVFFTSTAESTNANTDSWPPVESVDFVKYPLVVADGTIYDKGDLQATPLPEFDVPPGWEPVTFTIEPPPAGVHTTDGIVKTNTPIGAQLRTVTASRGLPAIQKTAADLINGVMNDGGKAYSAYQDAANIVSVLQAKGSSLLNLCATATLPTDPGAAQQFFHDVNDNLQQLSSNCTAFQQTVSAQAANVKNAVKNAFTGAEDQVKQKIADSAAAVSTNTGLGKLDLLVNAITHPGADPSDVWQVEASRIQDLILAARTEVDAWTAISQDNQSRLMELLNGWSSEVEHAIGSYSPFRGIAAALQDFEQSAKSIQDLSNQLAKAANNPQPITQLSACQAISDQYTSSVRNLTARVTDLRSALPSVDLTMIWPGVTITSVSAQFKATLQAAAANDAAQWSNAVTQLNSSIATLNQTAQAWVAKLPQASFDILQLTTTVQGIVNAAKSDLNGLKNQMDALATAPNKLLSEIQTKWTSGAQSIVNSLQDSSGKAMTALAGWATSWAEQEAPGVGSLLNSVGQTLSNLKVTSQQELQALQNAINPLAGQIQDALDRTQQVLDQNVRQPLMQLYQKAQGASDSAMQLVRAFGEPPQVPHLDLQPPAVAYVYDYANKQIPITPVLARANQVGQALNALGITLPATKLADALVPPELKNFDLNKILPNFSGLKLDGLFSGIKLPEAAKNDVVVTHGWDAQARRGWLQANVNVPFTNRMVVFQAGVFAFCLTKSTFQAQSRIENVGTQIRQSTTGSIVGDWSIELGGGDSLITFGSTSLNFDESGKLEFHFNPTQVRLADALKAVTALVQSFSDPKSGFSWGVTPSGVKCAFALPIPDTAALTSGFTGLTLSTSLELNVLGGFAITLALAVSSKDRPFNFAIFILGGCGYVEAGVTYHVDTKTWDGPNVDLAIGCSASLAIALGPISGGVYAQFAIELHKSNSGFRTGAFFQISGHVALLGIVSIDIVLRLEATYDGNVMTATGHVSYSIKMFMFSISVERDVTMHMGSGGQSSKLDLPHPPNTELAALAGPDGVVPGLAAAFAAADQAPPQTSPALRYVNMLL